MIQITIEDFKSFISRMGTPLFYWEDNKVYGSVYLASLNKIIFVTFEHSKGFYTLDDPKAFKEIVLDKDQFDLVAQLITSGEKIDIEKVQKE